jgi:hypothetical protein
MEFNEILTAWSKVAGALFNQAYETEGPDKHAIEEMATDAEYETRVVGCVIAAWENWDGIQSHFWGGRFTREQQEKIVSAALDNETADYGFYRGDLPSSESIQRALGELA